MAFKSRELETDLKNCFIIMPCNGLKPLQISGITLMKGQTSRSYSFRLIPLYLNVSPVLWLIKLPSNALAQHLGDAVRLIVLISLFFFLLQHLLPYCLIASPHLIGSVYVNILVRD